MGETGVEAATEVEIVVETKIVVFRKLVSRSSPPLAALPRRGPAVGPSEAGGHGIVVWRSDYSILYMLDIFMFIRCEIVACMYVPPPFSQLVS